MNCTFEELATAKAARIHKLSYQRVPGLTYEEVRTEITFALWRAWSTWDEDGGSSFDTWWFKCWASRKAHIVEEFFRKKRVLLREATSDTMYQEAMDTITSDVRTAYGFEVIPPCPLQEHDAVQVWHLLARGFKFKEVQAALGMGRAKFDRIIAQLRDHPDTPRILCVA